MDNTTADENDQTEVNCTKSKGTELLPMSNVDYEGDTEAITEPPVVDDDRTEVNCTEPLQRGDAELVLEDRNNIEPNIPTIREDFVNAKDLEPYKGMKFDSLHDAKEHYCKYAQLLGFSARTNSSRRSLKDRQFIAALFVCVKEGFRVGDAHEVRKSRAVTRVGCKAMMKVHKHEDGKWVVVTFERTHNHPLMGSNSVNFLQPHRNIANGDKRHVYDHQVVGTCTTEKMSMLAQQGTGVNNIDFKERGDVNHLDSVSHRAFLKGDARAALEYFRRQQSENSSFFYAIEMNDEEHIHNVLWVDARSKIAYEKFCDVVTFDSTYLTNKYRIPLASFVGVNHQGHSVLFGCALIADKTKESFIWVLKTWLEAMCGCHPVSIITDQDEVMQAAIAEVFPKTFHRLCLGRIHRKVSEKLSHTCHKHKNFERDLEECISGTAEEFESGWESLLHMYALNNDEWLQALYEDRKKWVPSYMKGNFFAGMSTTQFSESTNSFFDGHLSERTSIKQFVDLYDTALQNQFDKEKEADFETISTNRVLKTKSPLEKQAGLVYTRGIFKRFQDEMVESTGHFAKKIGDDGVISTYMVAKYEKEKRTCSVTFNAIETTVSCSCHVFDFVGILCRHVLAVFAATCTSTIPYKYFLRRWTMEASVNCVIDETHIHVLGNEMKCEVMRFNHLCRLQMKLAAEAAKSAQSYSVAVHDLGILMERVVGTNISIARMPHHGNITHGSNQIPIEGNQDNNETRPALIHDRTVAHRPPSNRKRQRHET